MECVGIKERITICGNGGKLEFDIDKRGNLDFTPSESLANKSISHARGNDKKIYALV